MGEQKRHPWTAPSTAGWGRRVKKRLNCSLEKGFVLDSAIANSSGVRHLTRLGWRDSIMRSIKCHLISAPASSMIVSGKDRLWGTFTRMIPRGAGYSDRANRSVMALIECTDCLFQNKLGHEYPNRKPAGT